MSVGLSLEAMEQIATDLDQRLTKSSQEFDDRLKALESQPRTPSVAVPNNYYIGSEGKVKELGPVINQILKPAGARPTGKVVEPAGLWWEDKNIEIGWEGSGLTGAGGIEEPFIHDVHTIAGSNFGASHEVLAYDIPNNGSETLTATLVNESGSVFPTTGVEATHFQLFHLEWNDRPHTPTNQLIAINVHEDTLNKSIAFYDETGKENLAHIGFKGNITVERSEVTTGEKLYFAFTQTPAEGRSFTVTVSNQGYELKKILLPAGFLYIVNVSMKIPNAVETVKLEASAAKGYPAVSTTAAIAAEQCALSLTVNNLGTEEDPAGIRELEMTAGKPGKSWTTQEYSIQQITI